MIRRLRCEKCGRYHNEHPDCFVPYKHYITEVISGVLDGIVTPDDRESEDYPTEQTMVRWKEWFAQNRSNMEGYLRNAGYTILNKGKEFLLSEDSLLENLQKQCRDWLEHVLRLIYNTGGFLQAIPW